MASTDISVAKTGETDVTLIIGTETLIRVPKCSIEGRHFTAMESKDNILWVTCPCCKGEGVHPLHHEYEGEAYGCDTCEGFGRFKKFLEPIGVYRTG
jgi:hypothetical protein